MMLSLLIWGMVIATSIWMAVDARANQIPIDSKAYGLNNGAAAWFFSGLVLWIATFPWYLIRRSRVLSLRLAERVRTDEVTLPMPLPPNLCPACGKYSEAGSSACSYCAKPFA